MRSRRTAQGSHIDNEEEKVDANGRKPMERSEKWKARKAQQLKGKREERLARLSMEFQKKYFSCSNRVIV